MSLEIEDVRAWLLQLHQDETAALLSEAQFDYKFITLAFDPHSLSDDDGIAVLELKILVSPGIYKTLTNTNKQFVEQVEAAISELSQHVEGSYIRAVSWSMEIPKLEDVINIPETDELSNDATLHDVQRLWSKAKSRTKNDPDGAITVARTMLESICKTLIDDAGESYTNRDDLPNLFNKAIAVLNFAPGRQTESEYRKLATSCITMTNAITSIRNREGDSHGGSQEAKFLHARFVVNVAGSLAEFLVGLRNEQNPS